MEKKLVNCPICGNKGLYYSELEFFKDGVLADWNCSNCKGYGSLDFKLSFDKFNNAFNKIGDELVLLDYDIDKENELRAIIAEGISISKIADKMSKSAFIELEGNITNTVLNYIEKNKSYYYNQVKFNCYKAMIEDYCTNNNIELDETTINEATENLLYAMLDYDMEDIVEEVMERY